MFYIALSIAIVILCIYLILKKVHKTRIKRLTEKLLSNWGKNSHIEYKENDFKYISGYFQSKFNNDDFYIDDITWNDIGMKMFLRK